MKKLSKFKKAYLIFTALCIAASAGFLIYVLCVVKDFDKSQPEHIVQQKTEWLSAIAADGTLTSELDFETLCVNRYENNNAEEYSAAYISKITGNELRYELSTAESTDLSRSYNIFADKQIIGKLSLTATNSRSRLFFFNTADWHEESFTPMPAATVYNLQVYQPDGSEVYINSKQPSPDELDSTSEIPCYSIKGLLNQPTIEYKDSDGKPLEFTCENNVAKPAVFNSTFSVPNGITVSVNGAEIQGRPLSDNETEYNVREMTKPVITFTDRMGGKTEYNSEELPQFLNCTVTVPEAFSLKINGKNADEFFTAVSAPHPDKELLAKYADVALPQQKAYSIALVEPTATAVISDNSGNSKEYTLSGGKIEVASLGSDEIPERISSQLDVMETAKNWSRFMTDDLIAKDAMGNTLGGNQAKQHGLEIVQQYFIKDSDYYNYAYQWATGVDITFTSVHTIDSFSEERISNFMQYNENCFSCEVYFKKNMTLFYDGKYVGKRTDVFNSILYFVYVDDTPDNGKDDPSWKIAVMHDVQS